VKVPVQVPLPDPYAVPDLKLVPQPVPLLIKQHPHHQENPKPQAYKERHYAEIAGGAVNIDIPETNYEIPVQSHDVHYYNIPDTYKAIVPNSHNTLHLPETSHQHAIPENLPYIPEYRHQSKPEAYYQGVQSAGIGDHGLDILGAQKEDSYAGLLGHGYLIHRQGPESHGYSYQRVNSC
jgi:hypothetical protein